MTDNPLLTNPNHLLTNKNEKSKLENKLNEEILQVEREIEDLKLDLMIETDKFNELEEN